MWVIGFGPKLRNEQGGDEEGMIYELDDADFSIGIDSRNDHLAVEKIVQIHRAETVVAAIYLY